MATEDQGQGYIKTTTHNYVSRLATIDGAKQVEIKGRSILERGVIVKGNLAIVRVGRYCVINDNTVIEPPPMVPLTLNKNVPISIGSHTYIGSHCSINAAAIGSMVYIGNNVRLGKRCIIKDNCIIEDGVIVGDDTVIPPFTRVTKTNPRYYNELPPSIAIQLQNLSLDRFENFRQEQRMK